MKKKYFAPELMSLEISKSDIIMLSADLPENEAFEGNDDVADASIFN